MAEQKHDAAGAWNQQLWTFVVLGLLVGATLGFVVGSRSGADDVSGGAISQPSYPTCTYFVGDSNTRTTPNAFCQSKGYKYSVASFLMTGITYYASTDGSCRDVQITNPRGGFVHGWEMQPWDGIEPTTSAPCSTQTSRSFTPGAVEPIVGDFQETFMSAAFCCK
ncbi:hypothetical protein HZB01_02525 [Candidatus Woesearchaeota archaeon]|nr:hypothetical protein [Candidatus Woesearchaeota archaeon]